MKKWMFVLWMVVFTFGVEDGVYRSEGFTHGITDDSGVVIPTETEVVDSGIFIWKLDVVGFHWLTGDGGGIFWTDKDWKGEPSEGEYRYGVDEEGDEIFVVRYYTETGVNILLLYPSGGWILMRGVRR